MENNNKELEARMAATIGVEVGPQRSWDPVNLPMIRHWCQAMGDDNPMYTNLEYAEQSDQGSIIAPPTMIQAWTMKGVTETPAPGSVPRTEEQPYVLDMLDEVGYGTSEKGVEISVSSFPVVKKRSKLTI